MTGIEAAGMKRAVRAVEEGVHVRAASGIRERLPSGTRKLERHVQQINVGGGFACKQSGALGVGVFAEPADAINRSRYSREHGGAIGAAENLIETVKIRGVQEMGGGVGVAAYKSASKANDDHRRPPVTDVLGFEREIPDLFLILDDVSGQFSDGNVAVVGETWDLLSCGSGWG